MTAHPWLRGRPALAVLASVVAVAVAVATFALLGGSPGRAFPALVPAAAPAGWPHLTLPNGTAVLSYPPSLRPVSGDADAVSAAQVSPSGAYRLYLNATPRQGDEQLRGWAAFRLALLTSDDAASARELTAAQDVTFRGGTGSCVIDTYVTRIGAHHYQEIACLVQGRASASVIVAAAPAATWAQASPLLFQAVAAYQVR
ncbi:MAG TPA: hypothetical protein VIY52_28760 [Streptosporangiaceae bacterium]